MPSPRRRRHTGPIAPVDQTIADHYERQAAAPSHPQDAELAEIARKLTARQRQYLMSAEKTVDGRWLIKAAGVNSERMRAKGLVKIYSASVDQVTSRGLSLRDYLQRNPK